MIWRAASLSAQRRRLWVNKGKFLGSALLCGLAAAYAAAPARAADELKQTIWKFDNLDSIAGFKTEVEGHPKVIATVDGGKAIEFNGVDDAMWVENHPLAGAKTFTIEA